MYVVIPRLTFCEAVRSVWNKYATFTGRARRSEYWFFCLFSAIYGMCLGALKVAFTLGGMSSVALGIYWVGLLAIFLPALTVTVRRLHDTGRSGWWYLLCLIPILNLVIFYFTLLDSDPEDNQYGPSPKYLPEGSEVPQNKCDCCC